MFMVANIYFKKSKKSFFRQKHCVWQESGFIMGRNAILHVVNNQLRTNILWPGWT